MRRVILLGAALLGLAAAACGPDYDRTEFGGQVAGPLGGEVTRERVVVYQGGLVKMHIVSRNDDDDAMSNEIVSHDPSVLETVPVVSDHDYAFLGITPGKTQIDVKADGKLVLVIDAVVLDQPASE